MKIINLDAKQIITLNDYPVHSNTVLSEYFLKCKKGEELPFVPVIKKDLVKKYFAGELLKNFESFEKANPLAEYFILDGSHRTTALSLLERKITAIIYQTDLDIEKAKELIKTGEVLDNATLKHSLEENCKILNNHFKEKAYFMIVEQKTEKMKQENKLPAEMMEVLQKTDNLFKNK